MTTVLDTSAILAFLAGEPGADEVEAALTAGAACDAVTWSEAARHVIASGGHWTLAHALLTSYALRVEPIAADDAEMAAHLWDPDAPRSLATRLGVLLADRLDATTLTADPTWPDHERTRRIG